MIPTSVEIPLEYLTDASGFTGSAQRLYVPEDEAQVAAVLAEALRTRTPVTVAGAGTGLTGARVPQGGWVLAMDRFKRIEMKEGYALAQAAVTLLTLRAAATLTGQMYPPDPTEITASVGGTVATNASGSRSFRYGSTRRWLRALKVATMDGNVRWYRRGEAIDFDVPEIAEPPTTKNTAGYRLRPGMDWVDLFCGSEGTLGVVLEAEVELVPNPKDLFAGVVFFASDADALDAVAAWRPLAELTMLEYADAPSLEMIRGRFPEIPQDAQAALLIEAEGSDVDAWVQRLEEHRALIEASWFAVEARDRERFRVFRHALPEAVHATMRRNGFPTMGTDHAVPTARDGEMLRFYRERLERELPGRYVMYGHIGDAHLHVNMLPATQAEVDVAAGLLQEFAEHAVELGGTVSAEHGLGKRKRAWMELQFTAEQMEAMRAVKRRLDPLWLLGKGTLFGEA